ncbi:MAG: glycosyltransferase family 9 protein, partial [Ktedonobacterales bacterium]
MSEEQAAAIDATYDRRPAFEARLVGRAKQLTKRRAQGLLWLLIAATGILTRTSRRDAALPTLRAGNPQICRILVVRLDLIGDVVLSLPAVRALRRAYPDATIDMLVQPSAAPVLAAERDVVARVLTCNPYRWLNPLALLRPSTWREASEAVRTLRAGRYDLAISVSGDMNSIFTRLSGARRRIGYAGEAYPFLLTDPIPGARYRRHQHEVRYVLALAEAAGATIEPADEQLLLHILPDAAHRAAELLQRARATNGAQGPTIAIHVGARNGQAKRWPPAHIAALSDRLVNELDALVLLTGAPNEAPLAQVAMRASTSGKLVNLTGKTTIPEL